MTPRSLGTLGDRWAPPELEEILLRLAATSVLDKSMIRRLHKQLMLLLRDATVTVHYPAATYSLPRLTVPQTTL